MSSLSSVSNTQYDPHELSDLAVRSTLKLERGELSHENGSFALPGESAYTMANSGSAFRTAKYYAVTKSNRLLALDGTGFSKAVIFTYDAGGHYIESRVVSFNTILKLQPDCCYIRLALYEATNPIVHVLSDHKLEEVKALDNSNVSDNVSLIIPSFSNRTTNDTLACNTLRFMLPPNYSACGSPSKLIIWCYGSSSYNQMTDVSFDRWQTSYKQLCYLRDSGYAVLAVHPLNSTFGIDEIKLCSFGQVSNRLAYAEAVDWLLDNYNIDQHSIYAVGKSQGGIPSNFMLYDKQIKVKAACSFAPLLTALERRWLNGFYSFNQNLQEAYLYAKDMGFEDHDGFGASAILAIDRDIRDISDQASKPWRDYVIANLDHYIEYDPILHGLSRCDALQIAEALVNHHIDYDVTIAADLLKSMSRTPTEVPLKVWFCADDDECNYALAKAYVQSIVNGGGTAEWRQMPNGTGKHYFDTLTDPNAIRVKNVTTRLGITYDEMSLAYIEALEFIEKY